MPASRDPFRGGQDGMPLALQRLWRRRAAPPGAPPASPPGPRGLASPHALGDAPTGVPAVAVDVAPPRATRGRPARLDVQDVVAAAVRVADSEGLQAVTIAAVAADLGVSPMGLYRHVSSKLELLLLLQDEGVGEPPVIDLLPDQWREGLRAWAVALHDAQRRRPWLARLPLTGPPSGPRQLAWLETALHALRGTRLGPAERLSAVTLVSGYVRQATLLEQDLAAGRVEASSASDHWRYVPSLLDDAQHPHLLAILNALAAVTSQPHAASAAGDAPGGEDEDFRFGLERVLDGLAAVA